MAEQCVCGHGRALHGKDGECRAIHVLDDEPCHCEKFAAEPTPAPRTPHPSETAAALQQEGVDRQRAAALPSPADPPVSAEQIALVETLDKLIESVAEQQAMPDESWRPQYVEIRTALLHAVTGKAAPSDRANRSQPTTVGDDPNTAAPPTIEEACDVLRLERLRDLDEQAAEYARNNDRGEEALSRQLDADAVSALLREREALRAALRLIARDGCRNYTSLQWACQSHAGRTKDAKYAAERWCDACIAQEALALLTGTTARTEGK